ncbi:MAG: hypothetical protein AB7F61_14600 [Desulfobulbus sp.]
MILTSYGIPGKGKTYEAVNKLAQKIMMEDQASNEEPSKLIDHQPQKNQSKNQE